MMCDVISVMGRRVVKSMVEVSGALRDDRGRFKMNVMVIEYLHDLRLVRLDWGKGVKECVVDSM